MAAGSSCRHQFIPQFAGLCSTFLFWSTAQQFLTPCHCRLHTGSAADIHPLYTLIALTVTPLPLELHTLSSLPPSRRGNGRQGRLQRGNAHAELRFSSRVLVTLCTRVSWVMDDLWVAWGSYQELLSSVTLARFGRRPVECFSTWAKPQRTEGDAFKVRLLIFGNGRTSLHPPLHTHTLWLPHSSVIREWKRNLVFTVTARLLFHPGQTQGCGGGWQAYILTGFLCGAGEQQQSLLLMW